MHGSTQLQASGWFHGLSIHRSTMSQHSFTADHSSFSVFNPVIVTPNSNPSNSGLPSVPRRTSELMQLFEEITGWQLDNQASERKSAGADSTSGSLAIIDMSASWPAGKPTGHRAKCDQLVELINQISSELETTKAQLDATKQELAAAAPQLTAADDEILVDTFVPKFTTTPSQVTCQIETTDRDDDTDFEVHQETFQDSFSLVSPPFAGWQLGGATGITENQYLDWQVDVDEHIAISAGKIQTDLGISESEAKIKIDPLTNEYQIVTDNRVEAFYLYDAKTNSIQPIPATDHWQFLTPRQAIIGSTANGLDKIKLPLPDSSAPFDAESLAAALCDELSPNERLLVLKLSR